MSSYHGLYSASSGPYGATSKRMAKAVTSSGPRDYNPSRRYSDVAERSGRAWHPVRVVNSYRVLSAPVPVVNVPTRITPGPWRASRKNIYT
eukprot:3277553-Amphidinium_carterae.1